MSCSRILNEEDLSVMVLRLAHEIRNPLATIKSGVQLIQHLEASGNETEDFSEYYRSILSEVDRINQVVQDMQRFVRMESHTVSETRVDEIVDAAVSQAVGDNSNRRQRITIHPGRNAVMLMDRFQVETAVAELVKNALAFSPLEDPISITWAGRDGNAIVISIEDHGPGISTDLANKIFRPFFSTSPRGTGIGLNIVTKIAAVSGGSLHWENLQPHGTRFDLVLPCLRWI